MSPTDTNDKAVPASSISMTQVTRRVVLVVVFLWFCLGGIAHFARTEMEMHIVPAYVPWPRASVLISGVFELLGAAGILLPATRRAAGVGLFMLTIAVSPANVFMLQHADSFPNIPRWALIARLAFQAVLLAMILWSTWSPMRPLAPRIDS